MPNIPCDKVELLDEWRCVMVCLSVKIGQDTGSSTDPLRSDSLSHWMPQFLSHLLLKTRQFADIQPKIGKFHNYILVFRRYIPMFNQANSGSIQAKSSTNQVKSCSSHHQPDIYIYINPNKSPFSCGFPMVFLWNVTKQQSVHCQCCLVPLCIQGAWSTTDVLQHGAIGHYGSNAVGASSVHEASSVLLGCTEAEKRNLKKIEHQNR